MKQAIALAGGGTKGAYQVGAWKAMRELGIPFDIVTGTSIGSVTAALMVQGDFDRAWELWTHITEEQIMLERADATPHEKRELAALAEHPEQLIARVRDWADLNRRTADITPYRALVHQYLDEARFFASPVDFGLMTARFPSFQPVEVRKQDIAPGYLPQWILASSACFPMFPMCEIDGQNYLDGAYSDNLPISTAFRLGADRVIVLSNGAIVADGAPKQVFSQVELLKREGLTAPVTVRLLHALRAHGMDVPLDALTVSDCADAVAAALKR
mgnify:CR=1 FL=1